MEEEKKTGQKEKQRNDDAEDEVSSFCESVDTFLWS